MIVTLYIGAPVEMPLERVKGILNPNLGGFRKTCFAILWKVSFRQAGNDLPLKLKMTRTSNFGNTNNAVWYVESILSVIATTQLSRRRFSILQVRPEVTEFAHSDLKSMRARLPKKEKSP